MSLTLLLEKYDVSTEEGLEKALNEIEKEESEVNEALTNVLSRACTLGGRLRTASQAYTKLGEVKKDAELAAGMVDKTAMLARDVSAKVRQLDLARSRVAECQRRVHDLIDLKICSAGVETAIKAHDYETAAGHVARFLSMEPGSVAAARARGAPDPRRDMDAAAKTLRDHLVKKFEEASRNEDDAAVERLFKLFPQIGRAEEGVELFAKYIASQLEVTLRRSSSIPAGAAGAAYADSATRVLEAAAARIERLRLALTTSGAHAQLNAAVRILQPTICNAIRRVCSEMVSARRLTTLGGAGSDPLVVEPVLTELALMHSRLHMYFAFLRRKIQSDKDADEATKASNLETVEKIIANCDMTRTAQDVLSHYLTLERYFLEESVNKALKLSSASSSSNTSSLVDDVFFIARKVIRRAISTSSVDGVCAVLNEACAALEGVAAALRRRLSPAPPDPLPLPPPARAAGGEGGGAGAAALAMVKLPSRDLDSQRALFLAQINECSMGAEWAELLAEQACADASLLCRGGTGASGEAKLKSCASGLAGAAAAFRSALDVGLGALRAALLPAVCEWADVLVDGGDVDEDTSDLSTLDVEEEASALPSVLDTLSEATRSLALNAGDAVLNAAVGDLLARAERSMLRNSYTRAGGLRVERRCRRLASWVGGGAPALRERAAALSAAATLLAIERVKDASDALPVTPMSPARVREVLARRIDFKPEEIKRLKL